MNRLLIIPAAGLGTRLRSDIAKILYPVNGRPMIDHLVEMYRRIVDRFIVIVHPSFQEQVRAYCSKFLFPIEFVSQQIPTGMLDAILLGRSGVETHRPFEVWITWCDQVSVHPETIRNLAAAAYAESEWALILPTVQRARPYIHFERNEGGGIVRVLQDREGDRLPEVGENDLGLFCLTRQCFLNLLPVYAQETKTGARTGERNFLPFIAWLNLRAKVVTIPGRESVETVGINTPEDLRVVETALAARTKTLSIVIPAYNEEKFIGTLLQKILAVDLTKFRMMKEVIVIDDCSIDRTAEIAKAFPGVTVRTLTKNSGKGAAVKAGLAIAGGDYLIIQDADLEYDPEDYIPMLEALLSGLADAIYGTRYKKHPHRNEWFNWIAGKYPDQSWAAYLGGKSLSLICFVFTGRYLTDTVTALKLFKADAVKFLKLETTGFELDHEITSKLLSKRVEIREVPIRYFPRSRQEGKKIGIKDWFRALKTFYRYRNG